MSSGQYKIRLQSLPDQPLTMLTNKCPPPTRVGKLCPNYVSNTSIDTKESGRTGKYGRRKPLCRVSSDRIVRCVNCWARGRGLVRSLDPTPSGRDFGRDGEKIGCAPYGVTLLRQSIRRLYFAVFGVTTKLARQARRSPIILPCLSYWDGALLYRLGSADLTRPLRYDPSIPSLPTAKLL